MGSRVLVSANAAGVKSDGTCSPGAVMSADGRYVVFNSLGANLVSGDTAGTQDMFRKDLLTGQIDFVVTTKSGDRPAKQVSEIKTNFVSVDVETVDSTDYILGSCISISADGRYIAFSTESNGLVELAWDATQQKDSVLITGGDNNVNEDVYVKDMATGEITLASSDVNKLAAFNLYGKDDPFHSASYLYDVMYSSLSDDGRYVAFASESDSLVSSPYGYDFDGGLYLKDLQTGEVKRINTNSAGELRAYSPYAKSDFSADGRFLVFEGSNDLVSLPENEQSQKYGSNIFRKDLKSGAIIRVGTDANGASPLGPNGEVYSAWFLDPKVSADGRYVVFVSNAKNLVEGDTNNKPDIFRKDLNTGKVELVSVTATGVQSPKTIIDAPSISANGRYVVFEASGSGFDPKNKSESFIKDMETGALMVLEFSAKESSDSYGVYNPEISANGKYVTVGSYVSDASTFGLVGQVYRIDNPFLSTGGESDPTNVALALTTPTAISFADTSADDTFAKKTGTLSASDKEGDTLTFGVNGGTKGVLKGTHGTLAVNSKTGAYIFTPNDKVIEALSSDATETFTVTVKDKTNTATANLVINLTGAIDIRTGTEANNKIKGTEGIDSITGAGGVDNLSGLGGNDTLDGGDGKDIINGGDADDRLIGGAAPDNLTGGQGVDTFVFSTLGVSADADKILDFTSEDVLEFSTIVFTQLVGATSANFFKGKAAADENDYLIYNSQTGKLYYDADGNGNAAAIQIAGISGKAAKVLDFPDFAFV